MTLPDERYRAVIWTELFLKDLLDSSKTPRVPKSVREEARRLLRHYPSTWDMNRAADGAPEVFAQRMEDVQRLFKKYEISKAEKE